MSALLFQVYDISTGAFKGKRSAASRPRFSSSLLLSARRARNRREGRTQKTRACGYDASCRRLQSLPLERRCYPLHSSSDSCAHLTQVVREKQKGGHPSADGIAPTVCCRLSTADCQLLFLFPRCRCNQLARAKVVVEGLFPVLHIAAEPFRAVTLERNVPSRRQPRV